MAAWVADRVGTNPAPSNSQKEVRSHQGQTGGLTIPELIL